MKPFRSMAGCLVATLIVGLCAAGAFGQYYVPLRYDLRYMSNPGYISSGVMGAMPERRSDPYAFGSFQYGNLELTGNVRAGRSFKGTVPYGQDGSQLSSRLPSMALSNFKRDSIGLEDLGTGVEYGLPTPYFPGSASVTNIYTAESRFATPPPALRAPYALPNLNSAYTPPMQQPPNTAYGGAGIVEITGAEAVTRTPGGLYVPKAAVEWVNALTAGRTPGETGTETRRDETDMRMGMQKPLPDTRIGIPQELTAAEKAEQNAAEAPGGPGLMNYNLGPTKPKTPQDRAAEESSFEATQSSLYRDVMRAARNPRDQPGQPGKSAEPARPSAATTPPAAPSAAGLGPETLVRPQTPGAKMDDEGVTETGEPKPKKPGIPPMLEPYKAAGTYDEYLKRAEVAMKEPFYPSAESFYAAAATLDPMQPEAVLGRVNALIGDRRYGQASLVLDRALRAQPNWVKNIPNAKTVFAKPEIYSRILADLRLELRRHPGDVSISFLLGYLYFSSGDMDDAKVLLTHVATTRTEGPGPEQVLLAEIAKRAKP